MTDRVKLSVVYPYPPEKVWQALTDCRILNVWMMKNDFEPCLGHKFKFESESLPGFKTLIHCEVVELEKPKRLVYTWQDKPTGEPSLVIWTLTGVEGGTQLQLKHLQTGYATALVGEGSNNSRQIGNGDRFSLLLTQQPTTNFNWRMPQASLHQQLEDYLVKEKDSKEDWHYRLNHRLLKVLAHYC